MPVKQTPDLNECATAEHALRYLALADRIPHRTEAEVETQLRWLREIGFQNVDCHWKWLELALLGGTKS